MVATFTEYQEQTAKMAMVEEADAKRLMVYLLGLSGETGEVAEKFKKMFRDKGGEITPEFKEDVKRELGDVLWYVTAISGELGLTLQEVAEGNIEKIESRKSRGVQHGNGDNR